MHGTCSVTTMPNTTDVNLVRSEKKPVRAIFIGSASDSRPRGMAERVVEALAAAGYVPLPWWHGEVFKLGDYTLERLRQLASRVDGAVFICTSDDKRWYRDEQSDVPRDNVVLEYGLFVATLGFDRAIIVTERNTRLPSDVRGITYALATPDVGSMLDQIVKHFDDVFRKKPRMQIAEHLRIAVDSKIEKSGMQAPPPQDWHQRSLYFGTEGARGWLAAVGDADYFPRHEKTKVRNAILSVIDGLSIGTLVSLGPGDAWIDRPMAGRLKLKNSWLRYVPVDISEGLLASAMMQLSSVIYVPLGILSDFEERGQFIASQLDEATAGPRLFSMLGNTFGNLDKYEVNFITELREWMGREDWFLLDVCAKGPSWAPNRGRRVSTRDYSRGERRFLATGMAARSGEPIDKIFRAFNRRVVFRTGHSDVDNTFSKLFKDVESGKPIFTLRRYDLGELQTWFQEQGFRIEMCKPVAHDAVRWDAVLLLRLM